MTGYLTQRGELEGDKYRLTITNMDIHIIFIRQIMFMFKADVTNDRALLKNFCNALQEGTEDNQNGLV